MLFVWYINVAHKSGLRVGKQKIICGWVLISMHSCAVCLCVCSLENCFKSAFTLNDNAVEWNQNNCCIFMFHFKFVSRSAIVIKENSWSEIDEFRCICKNINSSLTSCMAFDKLWLFKGKCTRYSHNNTPAQHALHLAQHTHTRNK